MSFPSALRSSAIILLLTACSGDSNEGGQGPITNPDKTCSLSDESYNASFDIAGPDCVDPDYKGEGTHRCFPGDRCAGNASCEYSASTESGTVATCGLIGKTYDAFFDADGPTCRDLEYKGEGTHRCFPGDRCMGDATCAAVLSAGLPKVTALFGKRYDAYFDADGPNCRDLEYKGEGTHRCFPGDRCLGDAQCEFVLSAKGGQVDESQLGNSYDAFFDAGGPRCRDPEYKGEGSHECFSGDRCIGDAVCEVVGSARD